MRQLTAKCTARGACSIVLFAATLLLSCGGGGGSTETSPAPPSPPGPTPDFSLNFDDATLPLQQQGEAQGQQVGVTGINGFSGTVTVSFTVPAGVSVSPPGPFQVVAGQTQYFTVAASTTAVLGANVIHATGTSGLTTHSATFTGNVTAAAPFYLTASPPSLSLTPAMNTSIVVTLVNNSTSPSNIVLNLLNTSFELQDTGVNVPAQYNTVGTNQFQFQVQASLAAQPIHSFPIVFTAWDTISGSTSIVTVPMSVTSPFRPNTAPTRSFYKRTDEDVTGAVYDPVRKLVFATVSQLSEVLVLSSIDGTVEATIPFTEPVGIDETTDGTKVYVGGASSIGTIDPDSLELVSEAPPPANLQIPNAYYSPLYVAALSNGKVVTLAVNSGSTETHIFLWDPAAQSMTLHDLGALPFPHGMTRSGDHSKVLFYGAATGASALYDAASDMFYSPANVGGALALSPNGSQIVSATNKDVIFYDGNFDALATLSLNADDGPKQVIYSRDGRLLYVLCGFGSAAAVATIDSGSFTPVGISPDAQTNQQYTIPYDIDETGMIFAGNYRGMEFADVSAPGALSLPAFSAADYDGLQPDAVSTSAPTTAAVNVQGIDPTASYKVFFGAPPASQSTFLGTNVTFQSTPVGPVGSRMQVTVPPAQPQVADMTIVRSDGWWTLAPLAAAFGPHIWLIDANSGPTSGGNSINIYGWGLDVANATVTIGGSPATLTRTIGPVNSTEFPFPVDMVSATTPNGVPGWADVTVTTSYGSTALPKGYEYLGSATVLPLQGALNQIIYDPRRQRVYVSNGTYNQVNVLSAVSKQYVGSIAVGMGPTGLALTPDGSRLAVVNSGNGTVSVVNPDLLQTVQTYNVLTSNDINPLCGGVPLWAAAAGAHGVIVSINCTQSLNGGNLHYLDLNSGSLSCVGIPGCESSGVDISGGGGGAVASSADGSLIAVGFYGGAELIDLNAGTLKAAGVGGDGLDVSVDEDRNRISVDVGIYNPQLFLKAALQDLNFLNAGFLSPNYIAGAKFSASGSLFFVPQAPAGGVAITRSIDLWDLHRQRLALRVALPEPLVAGLSSLCLDETASQMFAISQSGITMATLASVPLSVASVNPSSAAAGATVRIRGSGFETGAKVMLGATEATANLVDANTISAVVPAISSGQAAVTVVNPDGAQYTFDAAFTAN